MRLTLLAVLALACGADPTVPAAAAPAPPVATAGEVPDPVAKVGGHTIAAEELEARAAPGVFAARVQMQEARESALEEMIVDELLATEAARHGIEEEELIRREVTEKLGEVTDQQVEAFYQQHRQRMGGAALPDVRDKIAQHLAQEQQAERMRAFVAGLREAAGVEVWLPPLRAPVEAGPGARKGAADAPVEIIEFSDFQCPYCTMGQATVEQVVERYGKQVSVVFRHFPLPFHTDAHLAAQAAECAGEQGQFWAYHDQLFANQQALGRQHLSRHAEAVGLDTKAFESCVDSGRMASRVDEDLEHGRSVGMNGTPGFYINGRVLSGAQPLEAFAEVIDDELEAARAR